MAIITVQDVEEYIRNIEQFGVRFRHSDGGDTRADVILQKEYDYIHRARNNWTVEEWKKKRFKPLYRKFEVDVLFSNGKNAPDDIELSQVRITYLEQ